MLRVAFGLQSLEARLEGSKPIRNLFKRKNRRARRAAVAAIGRQYDEYVEDGGKQTFWEWLWANREDILEFILRIISIFAAL